MTSFRVAPKERSLVTAAAAIGASGWRLARDLAIDLEYADGYVIAVSSEVDEYGYGDTKESAIADLLLSLLDLRQSLERQQRESRLSEELVATLAKLNVLASPTVIPAQAGIQRLLAEGAAA